MDIAHCCNLSGWTAAQSSWPELSQRAHDGVIVLSDPSELKVRKSGKHADVFYAHIDKVALFRIDIHAREILFAFPDNRWTSHTLRHLLRDQIEPRIIAHKGALVIHAAAVEIESGAVLFVGKSGAGKSTIAAKISQLSGLLISDDAVEVAEANGKWCAKAINPSLRLLPESVEALSLLTDKSEPVAHYSRKAQFQIDGPKGPVPITTIFILDEPPAANRTSISAIRPANAFVALLKASFVLDPSRQDLMLKHKEGLSALLREAPVLNLSYKRDLSELAGLADEILNSIGHSA